MTEPNLLFSPFVTLRQAQGDKKYRLMIHTPYSYRNASIGRSPAARRAG